MWLLTLGIATPFIQQRLVRYFCDRLEVSGTVDIDKVLQSKATLASLAKALPTRSTWAGLVGQTPCISMARRPPTAVFGAAWIARIAICGRRQSPKSYGRYAALARVERHHSRPPFPPDACRSSRRPADHSRRRNGAGSVERAPQLKGGFTLRSKGRAIAWTAGMAASFLIAGYLVLQLAPQSLAFVLPDSWRERVGTQVEASLTEGATHCTSAGGVSALGAMAAGWPKAIPICRRSAFTSTTFR